MHGLDDDVHVDDVDGCDDGEVVGGSGCISSFSSSSSSSP